MPCEREPKSLPSRPMHLKALEEGSPRGPPDGDEESAASVEAVLGPGAPEEQCRGCARGRCTARRARTTTGVLQPSACFVLLVFLKVAPGYHLSSSSTVYRTTARTLHPLLSAVLL